MSKEHKLTTPVGRLVGGSIYEGNDKSYDGAQLTMKDKVTPRKDFSFSVAFPKTPGVGHWANEEWLKPIWALAHAAWPNGEAGRPDFAFKITDGDSTVPKKGKNNQPGKKPCDLIGHPGNWVVRFSGSTAPRVCDKTGQSFIVEPGIIKLGYYVQVLGVVKDNAPSPTPGLYWNHSIVAFTAHGEEISFGPDLSEATFGNAPLPAGALLAPPPGLTAPAPNVPGGAPLPPSSIPAYPTASAPVAPVYVAPARVMTAKAGNYTFEQMMAMPGWTEALLISEGYVLAGGPPSPLVAPAGSVPTPSAPAMIAPAPTPVMPNPAFVQVPPTPAVAARIMTPKAGGFTYEQMMASGNGWTDALLVQHGMMQA